MIIHVDDKVMVLCHRDLMACGRIGIVTRVRHFLDCDDKVVDVDLMMTTGEKIRKVIDAEYVVKLRDL